MSPNPHAAALGRLGRAANTPAQIAAARENGRQGGRPRALRRPSRGTPLAAYEAGLAGQPFTQGRRGSRAHEAWKLGRLDARRAAARRTPQL